jgi:hypothetical protein
MDREAGRNLVTKPGDRIGMFHSSSAVRRVPPYMPVAVRDRLYSADGLHHDARWLQKACSIYHALAAARRGDFRDDACKLKAARGQIMASLRNLAINALRLADFTIADGRQWATSDYCDPLSLLGLTM